MKKHFTKSLTVIFAVLGVYFVAFKVLMKVGSIRPIVFDHKPPRIPSAEPFEIDGVWFAKHEALINETIRGWAVPFHEPRWGRENEITRNTMSAFFAPLIWMERKVRGLDDWNWDGRGPKPDWVTFW